MSLGLENSTKQQSRHTLEYYTMWTTTKRVKWQSFPNQKKTCISWPFRLKCFCSWMKVSDLSLRNSIYFFKSQDWETKLKSFTPLSKTRLSQFHLHASVYSQYELFCWEAQKTPHKGRTLSWTLVQPLIPSAQVWEDGRLRFQVLFTELGGSCTSTSFLQLIACSLLYWN